MPADGKKLLPLTDLIRQAYEDGIVGSAQLSSFQSAFTLRNYLVHGVSAEMSGDDLDKLLQLIASVSNDPQPARHIQSP